MLSLVPYPKMAIEKNTAVIVKPVCGGDFSDAAESLCRYIERLFSVKAAPDSGDAGIKFLCNGRIETGGYRLNVSKNGVEIFASDEQGAHNGAATLLQMLRVDDGVLYVPEVEIEDTPDCTWRGVMIDLARDWHDPAFLYDYVDACHFYKIKYLHLHFTDDQSYTLPSAVYPRLSTENRHYSFKEVADIADYARKNGVEIIPEIDVPGHCKSFADAYGEIFGTNGIISLSNKSLAAMEQLIAELCSTFKYSEYIHVGGDEAEILKWTEDEGSLVTMREAGYDVDALDKKTLSGYMYAYFVAKMCNAVTSNGKTPVVWEGFAAQYNDMIPKNTVVMSWENFYQTTPELLNAGFRLINCSWSPLYVVTGAATWPLDEIYGWNVFTWRAIHPHSPYLNKPLVIEPTTKIEGAQLLAWGDHVAKNYPIAYEGADEERKQVFERMPALAENTWNIKKVADFAGFKANVDTITPLFERLIATGRAIKVKEKI